MLRRCARAKSVAITHSAFLHNATLIIIATSEAWEQVRTGCFAPAIINVWRHVSIAGYYSDFLYLCRPIYLTEN